MDLYLFSTDVSYARAALNAGVDGLVVDWEEIGKKQRQSSADTEINHDTPEDLTRLRNAFSVPILVRINCFGEHTAREVETAIGAGASEILLPMVRSVEEVRRLLDFVGERRAVGILIETVDAVRNAAALSALPLSRIYVGLNDLAIDNGWSNIFTALANRVVDGVREELTVPFGFGGLTHPAHGEPIPSRLLMSEMIRLDASFTFLRRSFRRDAARLGVENVVAAIREELRCRRQMSSVSLENDHEELSALVRAEAHE